jgi:hypothetical protein
MACCLLYHGPVMLKCLVMASSLFLESCTGGGFGTAVLARVL